MPLILYHLTTTEAAPKILECGFIGQLSPVGLELDEPLRGTWVSDLPLGNDGDGIAPLSDGDQGVLFEISLDMTEAKIADYEVREVDGPDFFTHREWCVPSGLLNDRGTLRVMSEDERWDFDDPRRWFMEPTSQAHSRFVQWRRSRGFESGGLVQVNPGDYQDSKRRMSA